MKKEIQISHLLDKIILNFSIFEFTYYLVHITFNKIIFSLLFVKGTITYLNFIKPVSQISRIHKIYKHLSYKKRRYDVTYRLNYKKELIKLFL